MRVIKINRIIWHNKTVTVAKDKIAGCEKFILKIGGSHFSGTYLVQTKNLGIPEMQSYGKVAYVIGVEDYSVLEPYIPPTEHDKMNLKDSFNNIIKSAKELPEKEEFATYEEVSQMCKEAQAIINKISKKKANAV